MDSPADELAWMRFLTLWEGIGDVRASKAVEDMRGIRDTDEAIEYAGERFRGRSDMIAALRQVRADWNRPSDAIRSASEALTPLLEPKYDRWEIRRRDFELLQRLAGQHKTVRGFIETYTLDPVSESEAERTDADDLVTLITVHSAKGTEAPVCYVIQLQPGTYPHIRSLDQREGIEEERRTLYVAMTRAENELIMTRTSRVGSSLVPHGGRRWIGYEADGDYFLAEVPEALIDWEPGEFDGVDVDDMIMPSDREL